MQNTTTKLWSVAILALILIFGSCKKTEILKTGECAQISEVFKTENFSSRIGESTPFREGSSALLGVNKLNPYTVANMTAAWQDLLNRNITTNAQTNVHTTHYYVKFKPKNSDEYEILHSDSTLALSDLPIESTVTLNGDYYHDPSLPDSVPTFQYTAVKVGYQFVRGIDYEIIDNLYIPEGRYSL